MGDYRGEELNAHTRLLEWDDATRHGERSIFAHGWLRASERS